MADRIVLYTLSTCPVCKRVARLLEDHGVEHRTVAVDMLENEEKSKLMAELEGIQRPVVFPLLRAGDRAVAGNHPDRIRRLLGLPTAERKGILERLFRDRRQ